MFDKDLLPSSTHPPLPPTSEDELFSRLRLLRSRRVGIATYRRLIAEHGSAAAALTHLPEIARAAGETRYQVCSVDAVQRELDAGRACGAMLLPDDAPDYPAGLHDLANAPPFLWCLGDPKILTRPMVALVGARNASSNGTRIARKLAAELGEAGFVVVSGMARGIDTAAHLGSLTNGTLAVLAGGVDVIYPLENAGLADDIRGQGLRLSEMPMGLQPMARHFPARNRIISGLAQATVVVEAAARSGSLITAKDALDIGRDVMAVPGHPFDGRAGGCNMLIRDGATLVRSAADVLDALRPIAQGHPESKIAAPVKSPAVPPDIQALHRQILDRLGPAPLAEDQLMRDLGAPPATITPALVELELNGDIDRQPGGLLVRVGQG